MQLKSLPPSLDKLSIFSLSWSRSISSKKHTEHSQYKLRNSTTHLFFTLTEYITFASIVLSKLQQNTCFVDIIQSMPLNGPRKVLIVTSCQLQSLQKRANTNLKSAPSMQGFKGNVFFFCNKHFASTSCHIRIQGSRFNQWKLPSLNRFDYRLLLACFFYAHNILKLCSEMSIIARM